MSKITDEQLSIIHQHNKRLAKSLGHELKLANPDMIAENMKTAKGILESQWIDGPPKDTGKGKFLLVMTKEVEPRFWDRSEGNLNGFILYSGSIIQHMRIPDYE